MNYLTIKQVKSGLANKQFSCQELVEDYFVKIEQQSDLNCLISLNRLAAVEQAKIIDQKISSAEVLGPLAGVPVTIKDLLLTKGLKTTAGSKILADYIAPYDATAVAKLKEAGAIILGKNNCDEFAMGSSNENSAFGPVLNPWDKSRVPGGSSGGSAAAVAADLSVFSIGTDTGGSIRQPAAFCGLTGLKPTYGRVSRYGLIAMTSSLDQAGPLTLTAEDAALVMEVIAGHDPKDATSSQLPVEPYSQLINQPLKGLKLGLPKEYFLSGMDREIEHKIKEAINILEKQGVKIKQVSLPLTVYSLATYYLILTAEVSSNLARYDGILYGSTSSVSRSLEEVYLKTRAEGFGDEVKRRIILGTFVLSEGYQDAYYHQALKVKKLITQEYQEVFKKVDCLITPTSPSVAFKLGEKFSDPLTMYLSDVYTVSANIAGLCGLSLPVGLSSDGLPIGMQILAGSFEEAMILRLAHQFQQLTDFHLVHP